MNNYQQTLWDELNDLANCNESFYFKDFEMDRSTFRIFNYRMCSYSDFCLPSAEECRGIMFEIDEEGYDAEPIRLSALPMEKFYNAGENPKTMDLDFTTVESIMLKADGSLISTYTIDGALYLKTKGSLSSDQAIAATAWLNLPENENFKNELTAADRIGFTTNMEWCAPDNRIVIGYEKPHLVVLNVRSREDGTYFKNEDIDVDIFPEMIERWVLYTPTTPEVAEFIASIPDMPAIEGFVVQMASGQHVKIKTTWYLALHHTKDSINSPRRLFEAVLEEATDDMRSLFVDDPVAIGMIADMEAFVEIKYNHLVDTVERFYERNKELERKEYAILGQTDLDRKSFGLAMSRYLGKDVSYKDFMKKNYKHFGIKDEKVETE